MPRTGRPKRSRDVEWECAQCGEKRMMPDWQAHRQKYCSRECFYRSGGSGGPRRQGPKEKRCSVCGDTFLVSHHPGYPARTARYCSPECRAKADWRQPPPNELEYSDAKWLAGLFDGEGSIVFAKGKPPKNVRMTITNTHYPLLERVHELVGTGTMISLARYNKNPKHKPSWNWQCTGENARNLLQQIYPYLIAKKEKAAVALEGYELREA